MTQALRLSHASWFDAYETLKWQVAAITRPSADFNFSECLGAQFVLNDFLRIRRADESRAYLRRTDLPKAFVESPEPVVGATLIDLGIVMPLGAHRTHSASPKQFRAQQSHRSKVRLRELLEEFESALRARVAEAMSARLGPDWTRQLGSTKKGSWVQRFDRKSAGNGIPEFCPQEELEAAQFSELLDLAFRDVDCAPHIVVVNWMSDAELSVEIERVREARNALFHHYCRATPSQVTIITGVIGKLAGTAGLKLDSLHPFSEEVDDLG